MKAEYFQAVEETFLQCTGRGLSISEADRSHIEHWFKAGIPLQIVQHAVMETCTDREQKVRTISFARKAVEKEFTAWQQKRVGRSSDVVKEENSPFEQVLARLSSKMEQSNDAVLCNALSAVCDGIAQISEEGQSKAMQYERLLELEKEMYRTLWAKLDISEKCVFEAQLNEQLSKERFINRSMRDAYLEMHRQKMLRNHVGLFAFDQFARGR